MPHHLISEWMDEIPAVPTYHPVKTGPRARAWRYQWGKKTQLSLTLVGHGGEETKEVENKWEAAGAPSLSPRKKEERIPMTLLRPSTSHSTLLKDFPVGHRI